MEKEALRLGGHPLGSEASRGHAHILSAASAVPRTLQLYLLPAIVLKKMSGCGLDLEG